MYTWYFPLSVVLGIACTCWAEEHRIVFSCGFEDDATTEWAKQPQFRPGYVDIHACTPLPGNTASGALALKLDATLAANSAIVYWRLPIQIPLSANPKVTARVWTGKSNTILAVSYVAPGQDFDQRLWRDFRSGRSQETGGWETVAADTTRFGAPEDPYKTPVPDDAYIDGFGLYLDRSWTSSNGRAVLLIDDIVITADLPQGFEAAFDKRLWTRYGRTIERMERERSEAEAVRSARVKRTIETHRAQLLQLSQDISPQPALAKLQPSLRKLCNDLATKLEQSVSVDRLRDVDHAEPAAGTAVFPQASSAIRRITELLRSCGADDSEASLRELVNAANVLVGIAEYPQAWSALPYWIGVNDPTRRDRILPNRLPPRAAPAASVRLAACRREYEPASLVIEATKALHGATIAVSDLHSDRATISASAVDVRWVKRWWQAGYEIDISTRPQLVPELLLKDLTFVSASVDPKAPRNMLKSPVDPRDAAELKPCDIPEGSNQQVWLTVRVPPDAPSGTYAGTITLSFDNAPGLEMPIRLEVYSFDLAESRWDSSIYYRGTIVQDPPRLHGAKKTLRQFELELANLREHGIRNPVSQTGFTRRADGSFDFSRLREDFEIRRRAGILHGPIIVLNTPVDRHFRQYVKAKTFAEKRDIREQSLQTLRAAQQFCRENDYPELMFYAIDEAVGQELAAERDLLKALHDAGGKVAVACDPGYFDKVGEYLACAIVYDGRLSGKRAPSLGEYRRSQALGHRIWIYGRPQGGVEDPESYRRNYGLMLWKRGEDGACTYAYQAEMPEHGDIWDDFDNPGRYRDHVMAYPTADGVIDTVQWEGYREAVDDLRYLSTLLDVLDHVDSSADGQAVSAWLKNIDINGDLTALRREIAAQIVRLRPKSLP
ncbi:MAG: hypothetical protein WD042_11515 [Phycisphaeraceae bacterium]